MAYFTMAYFTMAYFTMVNRGKREQIELTNNSPSPTNNSD